MLRRIGRRDRLVAAGCFGAVALTVLLVAGFSATPDPGNDEHAAVELVKLVHRGEQVPRIVDYEFTRTKADGSSLTSDTVEMLNGDRSAVRSGSSLEVALPDVVYRCELVEDEKPSCLSSPNRPTLPVSEVLTYAVGQGAYDVRRAPPQRIAGETASCFRVTAHTPGEEIPGLGEGGMMCLAADGVPLRIRFGRVGAVDERVARRVERTINDATMERVMEGFEPDESPPQG